MGCNVLGYFARGIVLILEIGRDLGGNGKHIYRPLNRLASPLPGL